MTFGRRGVAAVVALVALACVPPAGAADGDAPGAPGEPANWTEGDKDGFGTATTLRSKAWFTLDDGELTEVYYPDLGTPSVRDLQFVVSDGRTFAEREREDARHEVRLVDRRSLTYRQVNTSRSGRWRMTKTYATDPARSALLIDVRFESLTGRPLRLYALYDPGLSNGGDDDRGAREGDALLAFDDAAASALAMAPGARRGSSGYLGVSDGWTDLKDDFRMDWRYRRASQPGNVVQTALTPLTGLRGDRRLTLALGFGSGPEEAERAARGALRSGFDSVAERYAAGWHEYLGELERPRSVSDHPERTGGDADQGDRSGGGDEPDRSRGGGPDLATTYDVSLMVLAGLEDKTYRGAGIASPSMAWVWGTLKPSGPYHLVWSRDLYHVATAQMAAGDRAAAERALTYLWERQQEPDGCFPQNSNLDGSPHWGGLQLDEVAYPIILSWQLGRTDARTWSRVQRAVDCIFEHGPPTQERWENAEGWSPASIAAEIAGLVSAAEIGERNGDAETARRYLQVADEWQAAVEGWTVTTNGPLADHPYYLRLTVDGQPNQGTTYTIADGGPTVDQRTVVDTSYLELVRFGVKRADDPAIVASLPVVDRELGVTVPTGEFWHRFNHDGYGETPDGGPFPGPGNTGRLWPIFAGERGEYELSVGELSGDRAGARRAARERLAAIAATANDGMMLPEQVWDENPPSGQPGFPPGEGTLSSTPLGWTHAQFVRLAWSIDAGRPVERPEIVACRYAQLCD